MGKAVLPSAVVLAVALVTLLALATPAYPQTSSADLAADEEGNLVGPRPPDYEVTEDGTLIIGGDAFTSCESVRYHEPKRATPAARAQVKRAGIEAIRACQAAGFDTAGALPASASASSDASILKSSVTVPGSASPSSSATASANPVLPDTGGPALPAPLVLTAAVLLSAGGLLALRAWR